jgi:hypothetical protein
MSITFPVRMGNGYAADRWRAMVVIAYRDVDLFMRRLPCATRVAGIPGSDALRSHAWG